jgi:hypothetical protein
MGGVGISKEGGVVGGVGTCNPYTRSTGSGESRGSPLLDAKPGGLILRCVAHSTIKNGPGGVTGAGMGADVTADVGGGIIAWGCNENAVMAVGHGRTSMVHGVDVVISSVSISHNALG